MVAAKPKHLSELPDYKFLAYLKQDSSMVRERGMTSPPNFPHYGYRASNLGRMNADICQPVEEIDAA